MGDRSALLQSSPISAKSEGRRGAMSGRHVACGPRKTTTCSPLSMGKGALCLCPEYPVASPTLQSVLKLGLRLVRSLSLYEAVTGAAKQHSSWSPLPRPAGGVLAARQCADKRSFLVREGQWLVTSRQLSLRWTGCSWL